MKCLLLMCLLLATCYQALGIRAVVKIKARGITGTITFSDTEEGTRIETDLSGLTGEQGWHVHTLPIDQTISPDSQCLSAWAGPHYDPTDARSNFDYSEDCNTATPEDCEYGDLAGRFGPLPADGQVDVIDTAGDIQLRGLDSIIGRSVVIHERGTNANFECGTITTMNELNGAKVTILESVFVSPLAGHMYFKQVDGVEGVQIWGKLYYVDDSPATVNHNWHVHENQPNEDYRVGVCGPDQAGPHYDPQMAIAGSPDYGERCSFETPEGCEIGDLTGKLGTINVAATPNDAFFFTDSYLNLTGFQEIIGRSIVVHIPDRGPDRLGCAPLVEAETITLSAYTTKSSPLATISQYSPYQNTIITLGDLPSLDVPPSLGTENADLTIVTAALSPNQACPFDNEDSTFDSTYTPMEPVPGVTTPDGYALGDLSGAYGDDITSDNVLSVFDLPVFGARRTVSGRTLRFTYGDFRKCSALLPSIEGTTIVSARASFNDRDIGGNIFFFQDHVNDVVTGSTFIIVDIYYVNDGQEQTSTHNWHIHESPSIDGMECAPTIDGHYNPFMVSLLANDDGANSDYSMDCNGNYQLRCESGDMSGKHGQLKIASGSSVNRPTYSYVDNNLELGGTYTILGRSVGLHLPTSDGAGLFDCATVTTFAASETVVTTSTPVIDFTTRVEFASMVAEEANIVGVTGNDILILSQQVSDNGCVATSFRVLADTEMAANTYGILIADLVETSDLGSCGDTSSAPSVPGDTSSAPSVPGDTSSAPSLPLLTPLLLILPLLLSTLLLF